MPDSPPAASLGAFTPDSASKSNRELSAGLSLALAIMLAMLVALTLEAGRLREVWTTGAFFDTDDAMRMVQVRDLMAGQAWFDMTAWRLDPPQAMVSHWSRIVDMPLALLVLFFRLFLDGDLAERAARIAFPSLMLLALFAAGASAARIFAGRAMRLYGVAAMLLCGVMFWQFPPGRVDHHAPQIVSLLICVAALAKALDPRAPPRRVQKAGALSGGMAALSLAIGFENIPFLALVVAAPALVFILRGREARNLLLGFASGLAASLVLFFALTVGPRNWMVATCDALSGPHVLAVLGGCAVYGVLGWRGQNLTRPATRAACLVPLGALAATPLLLAMPLGCLADPFAGIDPVVRRLWLDNNAEVISLAKTFHSQPEAAVMMAAPILIGLFGALFGFFRTTGVARARWLLLAGQIAIGLACGMMHIRVFSTVMPLAALGLLAPIGAFRIYLSSKTPKSLRGSFPHFAALLALVASSCFGVAIAMPDLSAQKDPPNTLWRRPAPCLDSQAYAPLADFPPGLVISQIQAGPYILAHTGHSVLSGPYHRANHGNRLAFDILAAPPARAEELARQSGAKYVFLCWANEDDVAGLVSLGSAGLAARLTRGESFGWLRPLPVSRGPYHAYAITPPNQ